MERTAIYGFKVQKAAIYVDQYIDMNSSFVRISTSCSVLDAPIGVDLLFCGELHPPKNLLFGFLGKRHQYMVSKSKKRLFTWINI